MKSLKEKFGKFAVSTEKMATVSGGIGGYPGGDRFYCWGTGGEQTDSSYTRTVTC